ncbi:MAG: helix-turn-helix domain-containing protein [Devosia sp.]|uniref:helix-turn-helix transcriptional regulator n=1 Tax=Devosia sp. TaxID=1871048 RepID=UPI0019E9059D|nr:helix-turn-helix domain-containing protein [Devosia sp.]MBF0680828.1 helix-turn-helix domain-containing protein [Devosia sp.]
MTALLDDYLTRSELARELKVTERTIIRYQNQPNGLPRTKMGGRTLYRRDSVLAWLQVNEQRPNPRRNRRD